MIVAAASSASSIGGNTISTSWPSRAPAATAMAVPARATCRPELKAMPIEKSRLPAARDPHRRPVFRDVADERHDDHADEDGADADLLDRRLDRGHQQLRHRSGDERGHGQREHGGAGAPATLPVMALLAGLRERVEEVGRVDDAP